MNDFYMNNDKPLILISNDDGYHAGGINKLIDFVKDYGTLIVCAPESARSGFSSAFSATNPLKIKLRRDYGDDCKVWSCNGTPVDCVKMALSELCPRRPDLIIGGINHGDNASVNSHYSGTMGVTMEGCMKHIPSVAFSLCNHASDADFSPLEKYVKSIVSELLTNGLPDGVCLNVNFPKLSEFKGVRVCRMAHGTWGSEVVKCEHPHGYNYYWLTGKYTNDEPDAEDTDSWALEHGYVAITPTDVDVTSYRMMDEIKKRFV